MMELRAMTLGKIARSMTVGLLLAVFVIGLLPFMLVFLVTDVSGLQETDTTPIVTFINKFIQLHNSK